MREGARNFLVGLTAIGALVALALLMFFFGELGIVGQDRYRLTLATNDAAGLRPGGAVEFNGVPIGVIDAVDIVRDPDWPVRVVTMIDADVALPEGLEPFAAAPLIGGSARLQLHAPPEPPRGMLPVDGSATLTGPLRGGLLEQIATQLDARMQPLMDSLERFNELSSTYVEVGRNLNELLLPQSERELGAGATPNLRTAVLKLNQALDQVNEGLALAQEWLGDAQLRTDAHAAVNNANQLITQATTAVDNYSRLAVTLESDASEVSKRLLNVGDRMSTTLEQVERLAKAANEGEGTIGQLLNNPDLYNSLDDAAIRLERTLVDIQLLLEKIRAEGLPLRLF